MRYAVSFIHRRDLTPEKEPSRTSQITWAQVLGHDEVLDNIEGG